MDISAAIFLHFSSESSGSVPVSLSVFHSVDCLKSHLVGLQLAYLESSDPDDEINITEETISNGFPCRGQIIVDSQCHFFHLAVWRVL